MKYRLVSLFFLFFSILSLAQNNRLTFRPVAAEYSTALDRLIFISENPNQLLIYNPAANTAAAVSLAQTPFNLTVTPNGLFAAVGHENLISYINLTNAAVERTFPLPNVQGFYSLALSADWLYVLTPASALHYSIRLSDGQVTPGAFFGSLVGGIYGRLHPSQSAIYHTNQFVTGSLVRFDTSTGRITEAVPSINSPACGTVWYSPDGSRVYNGCGYFSQHAPNSTAEMGTTGTLDNVRVIRTLAESADLRLIAIVSEPQFQDPAEIDASVRLFDAKTLRETGKLPLPAWNVNNTALGTRGRWVFFNNAGRTLYAVHQAAAGAGIINDFAVQVYDLASPTPCIATFAATAITIPSAGMLRAVPVSAASTCVHRATTATPWLQIIAGGFGAGNSTLRFHAHSNTTQSTRTGAITIGNQTLTVTQDAAPAAAGSLQQLSYQFVDAEYSKQLDRLIVVSTQPDELHIYNVSTGGRVSVPLDRRPTAVSVRPDGLYAAAAHNGAVSYINLQTAQVERIYTGIRDTTDIVLTAGAIYAMSADEDLFAIDLSTGTVTVADSRGTRMRYHPSGKFLYIASSTSTLSRADLRQQPPQSSRVERVDWSCADAWISEDGTRYYTACGGVYRYSENAIEDGIANGSLVIGNGSYVSVANSAARALTAAIGGSSEYLSSVQLYRDDGLALLGRLDLSKYVDGTAVHSVQGRLVFFNSDASRLIVVSQVDASAGLLSNAMVELIDPAAVSGCTVSLAAPSVSISGASTTAQLSVIAGNNCTWTARGNPPWIHLIPNNPISSAGNGVVQYFVERNRSTAPRSGTITVNELPFTVNQGAVPILAIEPKQITIPAASTGAASFGVFTSSPLVSWTATSNASWLPVSQGASGTGDRPILLSFGPNSGPARTAILTVTSGAFSDTATITQEAGAGTAGMRFVPIVPCRVVDTRGDSGQTGAFGPPVMAAGAQRDFPIPQGRCNIPGTATAYSLNVTVVPRSTLSYITLWPTGQPRPLVSTLNSFDGRIKANAAIVPADSGGSVSAFVTDASDVILDINGYFVPSQGGINVHTTSGFRRIIPCRVVDTRNGVSQNGGPSLGAAQTRSFLLGGSMPGCDFVPNDAVAYSVNITAIPKAGSLAFLTAWPTGSPQPVVSTLNSFTGAVVANAAIVPAGAGGEISIFVTNPADVVIDLNGYFRADGLNYYPVTPCRITDTRNPNGPLGGPALNGGSSRSFQAIGNNCGIPSIAQAFVLNATVVPPAGLSYLTVWPAGFPQPVVSTLNAFDGTVTSNALLMQSGTAGGISAFVTDATHLILDTSGFFAP